MHTFNSSTRYLAGVALLALVAACGGGDKGKDDPTRPDTRHPANAIVVAGDQQAATVGTALPVPVAIKVLDQQSEALSGVRVNFSVASGGGSVTGAAAVTDGSGVARVGSWTLGPAAGQNVLRASVEGLGTPVSVAATGMSQGGNGARKWTVMVYLAADNNLAVAGVGDVDEMEQAGSDPNVQVVVQGEFSQTHLTRAGCQTAGCVNRPNWNTFRYAINGQGSARQGLDGAATDIGNRDMTNPAELRDFINWAKTTYPAEHYALVLWNHGGGYTGLIEDETSAGSHFMSLEDLRTALAGNQLDLLDFDMCLMGGYETLVKLNGLVDYTVFSEEVVPGEGNPYAEILSALRANPNAPVSAVTTMFADQFNQSYLNGRPSTTVSAYDMNGFANFEVALNQLATSLRGNLGALRPSIAQAVGGSQKFEYKFLTDIGDFLDRLDAQVADPTIRQQIAGVKAQATAANFRLRSWARTGTDNGAAQVGRSTGLSIVLPSGAAGDRLADAGPASFAAYQQLYPNRAWTMFLADWLNGAGTVAQFDQGDDRFESYLVWDQAAVAANADVDFWILEPDGNIYIPFKGTVTPNGHLTKDSFDDKTYFEGYLSNRYVAFGTYKIYASLYADPANLRPKYNLAYRFDQSAQFQWLLQQNATLSTQTSWKNDPNATLAKVEQGAYTDLQYVAHWDVTPPGVAARGVAGSRTRSALSAERVPAGVGAQATAAQLATLRGIFAERHAAKAAARASGRRAAGAVAPVGVPTLRGSR